MKAFYPTIILGLYLAPLVGVIAGNGKDSSSPVTDLITDITTGRVVRVDVLLTPKGLATRVNVDEEMLRKISSRTVTLKGIALSEHTALLLKALEGTCVETNSPRLDLRYGCRFLDTQGKEIHSLYIQAIPPHGTIDGRPASFPSTMMDWINAVSHET
jgi:hypothetical protein